jgi:hypothetical protein
MGSYYQINHLINKKENLLVSPFSLKNQNWEYNQNCYLDSLHSFNSKESISSIFIWREKRKKKRDLKRESEILKWECFPIRSIVNNSNLVITFTHGDKLTSMLIMVSSSSLFFLLNLSFLLFFSFWVFVYCFNFTQ